MQKKEAVSFFEAVSVLMGSTIGAGILAIPYAVSKVGWTVGVFYIVCLGLVMMSLNLMAGEISLRTKTPLQVSGMAGRYLGKKGKIAMTVINLLGAFGAMIAYLVGEGEILKSFFGGSAFMWTIAFWACGAILVYFGLNLIKKLDVFLTIIILFIVLIIVFFSAPSINLTNLSSVTLSNLFFPFGVILFAFQGVSGIPQVNAILSHQQKRMKMAIVTSGLIIIAAYLLFMTAVVGITGDQTTEIATIGLGQKLGNGVLMLIDIFAFFAMGTCFLNIGIATKNVFHWDYNLSNIKSWFLAMIVPLIFFIIGVRGFVAILDFVGGVFGAFFAILMIAIYWKARQIGDLPVSKYKLHHASLLSIIIIIVFIIASLYSLWSKLI